MTVALDTIQVRVDYETSTGVGKGNERIEVLKSALEIQESALTRIPEGYKVVSISGIQNNTVTVIVEEIPTTKKIKVVYLNGNDKVGEEVISVAIDATTVDEKDLMIPENYKFVSATNITTQDTVKVTVEPINGPVDPENPDPEKPDPENPNPETPENPDPENPNPENPSPETPEVTPEVKPEVTPDHTDDSELKSDSQITEKPAAASTGANKYDVPQTGDSNDVVSWLILMISSLALLVVSNVKRKRTK